MNSRLLALVIVAVLLVAAVASYCAYGSWREHRVDQVIEGMTREQVRKIAGPPDQIGSPTAFESSCVPGGGQEVWSYDLTDSNRVALVFDSHGRLICKTLYFISI
jgi:hypothetical protein